MKDRQRSRAGRFCAFHSSLLTGCAVEKGWTQERITALKIVAILALLVMGLALATQLVLTDEIDDLRQMKAAITIGLGAVVIGLGVVFTVPQTRGERSQIAPQLRKGLAIAIIVAGLFILSACYNWYKASM